MGSCPGATGLLRELWPDQLEGWSTIGDELLRKLDTRLGIDGSPVSVDA